MQGIPGGEKLIVGGDFNGHVGKDSNGYEMVHGGCIFGDLNEAE